MHIFCEAFQNKSFIFLVRALFGTVIDGIE